ncbi:hypothetical protein D1006_02965 [Burkholderia stabilis]|uniref:Uncharacterized protein n=1 Tax=Burkholderia stabilis TaxID=95485 RepID=A0A4Q2AUX7_9BURK|nr:hypothetical protein D1006_02965 [Burkholderia stabilis]
MSIIHRIGPAVRRRRDRITRSKVCFLCHSSAALMQRRAGMTQIPTPVSAVPAARREWPDSLRCA